MNVVRGGFPGSRGRYSAERFGIGLVGFIGIVVQNLIVYGAISIPILYQTAPLKVVFFSRKLHSRVEHPENFEEYRAQVRSILKIWTRIALPCGASSKF